MLTVVASYRQNVHAYPSGGGDYEVAKVNLGRNAGVTVASALLVDYVLTVAVSVSSGVQNAASAIPALSGHEAQVACLLVVVLAAINLRGVRESGAFFAVPTYGFMIGVLGMAVYGAMRAAQGTLPDVESADLVIHPAPGYGDDISQAAMIFLLARAFSSGLRGAHGCRGDLQRGPGVPQAQEQERRDHAAAARCHRGHDDDEHRHPGPQHGASDGRPSRHRAAHRGRRLAAPRRATTSTR